MTNRTRSTRTLVLACALIVARQFFCWPVAALRSGPAKAFTAAQQDLISTWRYHLWRLGRLGQGITTENVFCRDLEDGRQVAIYVTLLGGPVSLAFVRPVLDQTDLGLYFARHRLAPPTPIQFSNAEPLPLQQAPHHIASRLDRKAAREVLDLLGSIQTTLR